MIIRAQRSRWYFHVRIISTNLCAYYEDCRPRVRGIYLQAQHRFWMRYMMKNSPYNATLTNLHNGHIVGVTIIRLG